MLNFKKHLKLSLAYKILCLGMCVYQCYQMCMIYFSRAIITNVRYESQDQIELPGITVCYNKLDQLPEQALKMLKRKQRKDFGGYFELSMLTIAKQEQLFGSWPKKLIECSYYYSAGNGDQCINLVNFTINFNYQYYCFTIFSQLDKEDQDEKYLLKQPGHSYEWIGYAIMSKIIN